MCYWLIAVLATDSAFLTVRYLFSPSRCNGLVVVDPLLVRVGTTAIEDAMFATSLFIVELGTALVAHIAIVIDRLSDSLVVDFLEAVFPVMAAIVTIYGNRSTTAALLSDFAFVRTVSISATNYSVVVMLMGLVGRTTVAAVARATTWLAGTRATRATCLR